ncbi:MAG: hypothetical protein AB7Q00_14455 [Phycisphaerales bacterium]
MARKYPDNVGYEITTTGTGTITFGSVLDTYQSLAAADGTIGDGDTIGYRLEENDDWEIGLMTIGGTLTTGARSVSASSNSDAAIDLQGAARLTFVVLGAVPTDLYSKVSQVQPCLIVFEFNNANVALTTALRADFLIPFDMTITEWTLLLDQAATVSIDLWMDTYANYPPVNADSITNSNNPATSAADKAQSSSLGGWTTTALVAGRTLRAAIETTSVATRATLCLKCTRTLT